MTEMSEEKRRRVPKTASKLWRRAKALAGHDDLYYLNLAPGDPARVAVETQQAPACDAKPCTVDRNAEMRVVLHIHYVELWEELAAMLRALPRPWGLIVTLTPNAVPLRHEIEQAFPGADIFAFENRGRDIGPFFELVRLGAFDGARAVCKIHGKRSLSDGRPQKTGELWRRSAISLLLGRAQEVVEVFRTTPQIGAIGPEHLLLPSDRAPEKHAWRGTRRTLIELMAAYGEPDPKLEFFAGSMLWLAEPTLEELKKLDLALPDFDAEADYKEPSLAHACERIFLPIVRAVGLSVGMIPPSGEPIRVLNKAATFDA